MQKMYVVLCMFGLLWLAGCGKLAPEEQGDTLSIPVQTETVIQTSSSFPEALYTWDEVAKHVTANDCWTVIDGSIYDISNFSSAHPGGADPILSVCGKDGTSVFNKKHGKDIMRLERFFVAKLQ